MKLIVINDIFKFPSPQRCISTLLQCDINIEYLSLNILCGMPLMSGKALHGYLFEQDGMNIASHALRAHCDPNTIGLGYSAGGTAFWRAGQNGMLLKGLFCVSRPNCAIWHPFH
jgi:hypothetical protein